MRFPSMYFLLFVLLTLPVSSYSETLFGTVFMVETPSKIKVVVADEIHDIYLAGVESPGESHETTISSRDYLSSLTLRQTVKCVYSYDDKNKESRYFVFLADGTFVNDELLKRGLVWKTPNAEITLPEKEFETTFFTSLSNSDSVARKKGLGIWSSLESVPPWERARAINANQEYLRRVGESPLEFEASTKWPLRDLVRNGSKVIATDTVTYGIIKAEDIASGLVVIHRGADDISLMVESDTYNVPIKETSTEMRWINPRGNISFYNDQLLCTANTSGGLTGMKNLAFANCMDSRGWILVPVEVEYRAGTKQLVE